MRRIINIANFLAQVSKLHEYQRRKKTVDDEGKVSKDKRIPSVKKELSSQKEISNGQNDQTRLHSFHTEMLNDVPRLPNELSKNDVRSINYIL